MKRGGRGRQISIGGDSPASAPTPARPRRTNIIDRIKSDKRLPALDPSRSRRDPAYFAERFKSVIVGPRTTQDEFDALSNDDDREDG